MVSFYNVFKGIGLEEIKVKVKSDALKFEDAFVSLPFRG
jgi:hypothetical protein